MKFSEFSDTATDSPPIKDEITALEHQIAHHRARIKSRSYALEYQARKRVTSPFFLLLAAGAGFMGERYLSRKHPAQPKPNGQAQVPKQESIIEKALKTVTLIQGVMASYPVMLLRKHFDEQNRHAPNAPPPSPASDARHYH